MSLHPSYAQRKAKLGFALIVALCRLTVVHGEPPELHDKRFEITLLAEHPDIVTPIGLAIDARDRLYVLESHTHHPPKDYDGPKDDRIKIFVDEDRDGKADGHSIFAEGLHQAMNLAFSPSGVLYAVCAREVLSLPDRNGDGRCDGMEKVLTLDTKERYAHNSLLGITFGPDGWLYIARGNTGSHAYRMREFPRSGPGRCCFVAVFSRFSPAFALVHGHGTWF